jgi:hypothetical protein
MLSEPTGRASGLSGPLKSNAWSISTPFDTLYSPVSPSPYLETMEVKKYYDICSKRSFFI